jgi:hypothetical protein
MSNEMVNPQDFWSATNLDQSDFAIPRITIGQANTTKGKPGYFNYNSGSSVEEMKGCKILVPRKTRVLYGKGINSRSRCKSDNFYNPSKHVEHPISSSCVSCYAAQWGDAPEKVTLAKELGANDVNKPLCAETYNILMADGSWNMFFISFQKTQLKLVQEKLFSRLQSEFAGIPPYAVGFDMKLERIQSANGNVYYSTVFDNFRTVDDYDVGEKLWRQYSTRAEDILSTQHEGMDTEKDVTPQGIDYNEEVPY